MIGRGRAGAAGIEFAIVVPTLLVFLVGVVDLSDGLLTQRRMEFAATSVAQIASLSAAQAQSQNQLTDVQGWQATTAAFAFFPGWGRQTKQGGFTVTVSGINFTSSSGTYAPTVAWSVSNQLGSPILRPCGAPQVVASGSTPSFSAIPAGDVGPTALVVSDVVWTFTPPLLSDLVGSFQLRDSAYLPARLPGGTQLIEAGGPAVSARC